MLKIIFNPLFVWLAQKKHPGEIDALLNLPNVEEMKAAGRNKNLAGVGTHLGVLVSFVTSQRDFFVEPGFSAHFLWSMQKKFRMDLLLFSILDYLCYTIGSFL